MQLCVLTGTSIALEVIAQAMILVCDKILTFMYIIQVCCFIRDGLASTEKPCFYSCAPIATFSATLWKYYFVLLIS